ncbi:MAG: sugar-binding domain-containing protein, partial [Planctomycetota bacterium]|jgi:beta-galactosidase/beta-glucuronidase
MTIRSGSWICTLLVAAGLLLLSQVGSLASESHKAAGDARQLQSLDGTWEITFDPQNQGRQGRWHQQQVFAAHPNRRDIPVPSCWELIEKDYEGVAFYRRTFKVPENWEGKVIRLHFDAVNFLSEVWINDQAVGVHEGGFTPFEFRIDNLIKPREENTLILRVVGPILLQDKQVDGMGPMETPQWRGAITGGIWQSVRLSATDDMYVKDVFIEPKISDNTATFHLEVVHTGKSSTNTQIEIAIRSANRPDEIVARMNKQSELKPGSNRQSWTLQIPDAVHWSPDNPHLYRADVSVAYDGTVS